MTWFRLGLKIMALVLLPVLFWGFLCPGMVNSQVDILVMSGLLFAWLVPPGMIVLAGWALLEVPAIRAWWMNLTQKVSKK